MLSQKTSTVFQMITAIVLVIVAALLVENHAVAQSATEKEIIKTFTKTVNDFVPVHIDKRHTVIHPSCGWLKQYYEPSADHAIDVHKTDSIVSPYLGVVEFNVIRQYTECHKTQEEAEKDDVFTDRFGHPTGPATHRYTFAFQDDVWVLKTRAIHFGSDEKLYPCNPPDGCI